MVPEEPSSRKPYDVMVCCGRRVGGRHAGIGFRRGIEPLAVLTDIAFTAIRATTV